MMPRIVYFAADLTDPALVRRVQILRRGGADVVLLGFRRSASPVTDVAGLKPMDLGRIFHGRLWQRSLRIIAECVTGRWCSLLQAADVVMARDLTMVLLADMTRRRARLDVPLAYECLDLHRMVLAKGVTGRLLRSLDRRILRRTACLIVSSPAYIANYFGRLGVSLPRVILTENKRVLNGDDGRPVYLAERRPPWRIGWFGNLRCVDSFRLLLALAQRNPHLVRVVLRGRPPPSVATLIERHLPLPNMEYGGAYSQSNLRSVYDACDLIWAIEHCGLNSDWCLANRLYEGGYYNRPAIALHGTETAAWLEAHHAGVILRDSADLERFLGTLTTDGYRKLWQATMNVPTTDLMWSMEACQALVQRLMAGDEVCVGEQYEVHPPTMASRARLRYTKIWPAS